MAHLIEFKISGLAGRKDVYKQKLNRDVNIFYGPNGSGKTSLLKILHSAIKGDAEILKTVPFKSAEVTIHSVDYKTDFVRTIHKYDTRSRSSAKKRKVEKFIEQKIGDTENTSNHPATFNQISNDLAWTTKGLPPKAPDNFIHIYLPTFRLYSGVGIYSLALDLEIPRTPEREYDWDLVFAQSLEDLWTNCTNELLSKIQEIQGKGLVNILKGILSTRPYMKKTKKLNPDMAYERVSAFLKRQGSSDILGSKNTFIEGYRNNLQLRKVVDYVNLIESRIEKVKASRNRLEQLIQDMFTTNKTVIFKDTGIKVITDDGQSIGLNTLSSGEKHILWILIEVLLVGSGPLLIDEPEISMHIDWQNRLISALRQLNPDSQLILATHSPEIMADIADSKIFRL